MSGHSKWSTIKRQKEANDKVRGQLFSKLAKAITIAVKTGGGENPDSNHKLKMTVETAKAANMPKENIERAISKGTTSSENIEEVTYEGFAPYGVGVLVEVATDNRNRTGQELKNIFEKAGGGLAGPGSVSFNFEPKGLLVIEKVNDADEQLLTLIDLGVEDVEDMGEAIEAYVQANSLFDAKKKIETAGFVVSSAELLKRPKNLEVFDDIEKAKKLTNFLSLLEENEDVQKVFSNFDVSSEVAKSL